MRRFRAFTLIELLVVIAIIAILAAILFPVFARAKEAAIQAKAISQMRQLGLVVMMYASDNDDTYVPATNYDAPEDSPSRIWTVPTFPYAKNKEIYIAPGSNTSKYAEGWSTRHRQSIGMNGATAYATALSGMDSSKACSPNTTTLGCEGFTSVASESSMDEPATVGLFAVTPDGEPGTKYRGYVFSPDNGTLLEADVEGFDYRDAVPLASDRDLVQELGAMLTPSQLKPIYARYGKTGTDQGRTPVIFADGHAKTYSAASIKSGGSGILWRFR